MTARFLVADVFDGLASLEDGSVDLVVTSPPFLALRSYLPADHPDKGKEIGSEATPAEFIDVLLRVTQELRRVLAPHGSICVELGDTYAGSGGGGGDYLPGGMREGQQQFAGSEASMRESNAAHWRQKNPPKTRQAGARGGGAGHMDHRKQDEQFWTIQPGGKGWPLAKSRTLIPQLYEIALAYGINPLTGQPSPAGQWRIRNVVTWARPNPPVGALGDKWRPATSDLIVACTSGKRYWDDLATRKPHLSDPAAYRGNGYSKGFPEGIEGNEAMPGNPSGAPLLDYWVIPPGGYKGSHYAVMPEELVVPCVKAMCPTVVCLDCGEPARRLGEDGEFGETLWQTCEHADGHCSPDYPCPTHWRPGLVLDPFAGSGTTLAVATGHGHDAIGIDLDQRNADLALDRVGPFMLEVVDSVEVGT